MDHSYGLHRRRSAGSKSDSVVSLKRGFVLSLKTPVIAFGLAFIQFIQWSAKSKRRSLSENNDKNTTKDSERIAKGHRMTEEHKLSEASRAAERGRKGGWGTR